MAKKILFSGIKPSGQLHLGNYLGALKNWVELQGQYETIYSIVDYHALTENIGSADLERLTFDLAVDLLALGIDPRQSIFFLQSDVPEHTELTWIFNCLTPVAELERMTQYKAFVAEKKSYANAGLFDYPVLQAADIMIYQAEYVPVGEDQLQHLELARIIGRKFNSRYGQFFPDIKPVLSENVRVMSLNDPKKKMSKSLGPKSYIALRDDPQVIQQKISKAVTDSLGSSDSLTGGHNLLMLYKSFAASKEFQAANRAYELKKISYADLKKDLAGKIIEFLRPIQEKQRYFENHPKKVSAILADGAHRARSRAQKTMSQVRRLMGIKSTPTQ